ncbi:MAG: hypothetical protein JWN95_168 [Frankiales bacterium]|nr:hypothetical protein [Frankiales bacterium]
MTTPGFFEIYPDFRPALPAGLYTTTSHQDLAAAPPTGDGAIHVDDTQFFVHIDSPRYVMPPEQILSTFPPAGSQGDWRERLPQIVLKRRTMPWERNPGPTKDSPPVGPPNPDPDPATAPPWLALIVLADGEGQLSTDVDVSQCVTPGVNLGDDADVPQGKYLEVTQDIIDKVFPCLDELALLSHVRKVDLRDTALALGDDDGYLSVVLSSRLPQPGPPAQPGGGPTPLKYTACLINLERQLPRLLPTEPNPILFFDATSVTALVTAEFLAPAPNATIDQIAMNIGPGVRAGAFDAKSAAVPKTTAAARKAAKAAAKAAAKNVTALADAGSTQLAPYAPAARLETAAAAWNTGPVSRAALNSTDLALATGYKFGVNDGLITTVNRKFRFPVLVSWEFTCTGDGGFERLMNALDVGLLGTLDGAQPPPLPEVAATGHVALSHRTRRGEPATSWYRGPLGPQPTERVLPVAGVLPLANTGDQLRRVVPDGREDVSLAAMFEIGRLLTLSKPTLVAALMKWRRDLFGAARARELSDALSAGIIASLGVGVIGGRSSLEDLVRTHLVGAFTSAASGAFGPKAQTVTASRVPPEVAGLGAGEVLTGLGVSPQAALRATKQFGAEGLAAVPLAVGEASTKPVSGDQVAFAALQSQLAQRVDQLTADVLKTDPAQPKDTRRRSRRRDTLDALIEEAAATVARSRGER